MIADNFFMWMPGIELGTVGVMVVLSVAIGIAVETAKLIGRIWHAIFSSSQRDV